MSTYLTHLAVDAKTLPGNQATGLTELTVTPGTYLIPTETEAQAREAFESYDELLEPNAELRIYRIDRDYDIDAYQAVLDDEQILTPEDHGAEVIEYRAFAGVPRRTSRELSDLLDETVTTVDETAKTV